MESSRYASHLQEWKRAFGSEQVLPTFYDDLRDDPQGHVDALSAFIGLLRFLLKKLELRAIHASETMTHPRNYNRTHRATLIADWFKAGGLGHIVAIVSGSPIKKVFLGGGTPFSQPPPETMQMVHAVMQHEVEELEGFVNRDHSAWKRPSIPSDRSEIPPGQPHGIDHHALRVLQEHVENPEIQCTAEPCGAVAMVRGFNSTRRLGTFASSPAKNRGAFCFMSAQEAPVGSRP